MSCRVGVTDWFTGGLSCHPILGGGDALRPFRPPSPPVWGGRWRVSKHRHDGSRYDADPKTWAMSTLGCQGATAPGRGRRVIYFEVARKAPKKAAAGGSSAPSAAEGRRSKAGTAASRDKAAGTTTKPKLNLTARDQLKAVFDELDKDGSDELDYSDLKEALRTFGVNLSLSELKHVWTAADKDASSGLSFEEFVQAIEALPERLPQRRSSMINLVARVRGDATEDENSSVDRKCAVM
jgi:hypothetical protein